MFCLLKVVVFLRQRIMSLLATIRVPYTGHYPCDCYLFSNYLPFLRIMEGFEPYSRVRVLKIATFEGSGFLGLYMSLVLWDQCLKHYTNRMIPMCYTIASEMEIRSKSSHDFSGGFCWRWYLEDHPN